MSDEFPVALLKDAIPSADKNPAGQKSPYMNIALPPQVPQQAAKPAAPRKRKPAAPPAAGGPVMRAPRLPQDPDKLNKINATIDMVGGGTIKHGGPSPYANYDPYSDRMVHDNGTTVEMELAPVSADGPLVPSDEELMAQEKARTKGSTPARPQSIGTEAPDPGPVRWAKPTGFLDQTCRVTMELTDGMMTISAIAVRENAYSLLMLLKITPDGSIFIPKPGTKLHISVKDKNWDVYFPGAYVEIEELQLGLMTFIKAEANDGKA